MIAQHLVAAAAEDLRSLERSLRALGRPVGEINAALAARARVLEQQIETALWSLYAPDLPTLERH